MLVYLPTSPGLSSSQGRLAEWTGKKVEEVYANRFKYMKLVIDDSLETGICQTASNENSIFSG